VVLLTLVNFRLASTGYIMYRFTEIASRFTNSFRDLFRRDRWDRRNYLDRTREQYRNYRDRWNQDRDYRDRDGDYWDRNRDYRDRDYRNQNVAPSKPEEPRTQPPPQAPS
jgi:hypothetical protein